MKKLIEKCLTSFESSELEGPLDELLTKIKAKMGSCPGYDNFRIAVQRGGCPDYENDEFVIYGKRLETDAEYEARLKRQRAVKESTERRKAAQKRKLLDKFNEMKQKLEKQGIICNEMKEKLEERGFI